MIGIFWIPESIHDFIGWLALLMPCPMHKMPSFSSHLILWMQWLVFSFLAYTEPSMICQAFDFFHRCYIQFRGSTLYFEGILIIKLQLDNFIIITSLSWFRIALPAHFWGLCFQIAFFQLYSFLGLPYKTHILEVLSMRSCNKIRKDVSVPVRLSLYKGWVGGNCLNATGFLHNYLYESIGVEQT